MNHDEMNRPPTTAPLLTIRVTQRTTKPRRLPRKTPLAVTRPLPANSLALEHRAIAVESARHWLEFMVYAAGVREESAQHRSIMRSYDEAIEHTGRDPIVALELAYRYAVGLCGLRETVWLPWSHRFTSNRHTQ